MSFTYLKQLFLVLIFLSLLSHVGAASNLTVPTLETSTNLTGVSFQQYIIDLDMTSAEGILVQETWTLLSNYENSTVIGLSIPKDAVVMRFQRQDMSNVTYAADLKYNRTGDIVYFSENLVPDSSGLPQVYSMLYLLPGQSGQFTKMLTVPGYQPSSINSLILNVKTSPNVNPAIVDGNGMAISADSSKREGNITVLSFSNPSFNEIIVSATEGKKPNNAIYLSVLFFIAGLVALGGAIYQNWRKKDTTSDFKELETRYAAIQKVLSTIDSDLKEKTIDEDVHSSMSSKYRKEAARIKKEMDKRQNR